MLSLAWNGCFSSRQSEFRIDLQTSKIKVCEIDLRLQYNTKAKKLARKQSLYVFYGAFFFFNTEDVVLERPLSFNLMTIQDTNHFFHRSLIFLTL